MKRDSESEKEETVDNADKKNFRKGYRSWGEIEEKIWEETGRKNLRKKL